MRTSRSTPKSTLRPEQQVKLLQQVINRKYTPSMTGTEMYFYVCETDKHRSKHFGINPITDTTIMTAALQAFSMEHHGEQLQCIAESWDIVNAAAASPQE